MIQEHDEDRVIIDNKSLNRLHMVEESSYGSENQDEMVLTMRNIKKLDDYHSFSKSQAISPISTKRS
jgi:hypothetical protein